MAVINNITNFSLRFWKLCNTDMALEGKKSNRKDEKGKSLTLKM